MTDLAIEGRLLGDDTPSPRALPGFDTELRVPPKFVATARCQDSLHQLRAPTYRAIHLRLGVRGSRKNPVFLPLPAKFHGTTDRKTNFLAVTRCHAVLFEDAFNAALAHTPG